jgi:hypothetical protein
LSTGVSRRTLVRGLIWQPLWWAVESLIQLINWLWFFSEFSPWSS